MDEFQDVNYIQMEFIKLINKDYNYLLVVGDADQAIYSFRWCDSYYFNNIKELYPKTRIYELNDNYRSDWHIIALANNLIENNFYRYKKIMKPIKEYKNVPKLLIWKEEKDLFLKIANKIKKLWNYSETAILYRNNSNSLQIQKILIEQKIPFKVYWWQNIFNKKYSKDLRAFVSILNEFDVISLERVLTLYPGVWKTAINKIINEINILLNKEEKTNKSKDNNPVLFDINELNKESLSIYDKILNILSQNKKLSSLIKILKDFKLNNDLEKTLEDFINKVIDPEMKKKVDIDKYNDEKINLEMVLNIILNLFEEKGDIKEIMETIVLDNIQEKEDNNVVTLSTIHRSKWLEWDNVFIIKAYKNLFPSFKSMDTQFLLEEERNLFYVAVTRAKENLFIWLANWFYQWIEFKPILPSIFINEIEEYIENEE